MSLYYSYCNHDDNKYYCYLCFKTLYWYGKDGIENKLCGECRVELFNFENKLLNNSSILNEAEIEQRIKHYMLLTLRKNEQRITKNKENLYYPNYLKYTQQIITIKKSY